jgi:hypothetical protein
MQAIGGFAPRVNLRVTTRGREAGKWQADLNWGGAAECELATTLIFTHAALTSDHAEPEAAMSALHKVFAVMGGTDQDELMWAGRPSRGACAG